MISTNYTDNIRRKRKLYGIAGAFLTLAIPFLLLVTGQSESIETAQSLCPFKMLTGFPCPGCGITKSLVFLYEGDLHRSISYHILGPFAVLFSILTILVLTLELNTGKEYFNGILFNIKLAYGLGIFLGVYHLIRLVYFISENNIDSILEQSIWR